MQACTGIGSTSTWLCFADIPLDLSSCRSPFHGVRRLQLGTSVSTGN